ncbi:hypothetical protein RyT2_18140 [Pseudolactococcus yaeyamensis]
MLKTKQLMKNSYQILNSLTPDNGQFLSDLMSYLRTKGLLKNALRLELKINEIANDLKKADLEGISAETFFGNRPKEMAQDILNALPNDTMSNFFKTHLLLFIVFVGTMPFAFSSYTIEVNGINHSYFSLLTALIMASCTLILMIVTSALVSRHVFNPKAWKTTSYLIWLALLTPYILPILLRLYQINIWQYELPTYLPAVISLCNSVILVISFVSEYPIVEGFKARQKSLNKKG